MPTHRTSRPYRKVERARKEEETRLRITEAAVELHGTVGPANTSVTELAKLAGVSRMTVYNHFPTELDLFRACSSHWMTQHPPPDPATWPRTGEPSDRLVRGLAQLYAWYSTNEAMMGKVLRDAGSMPPVASVLGDMWWPYLDEVVRSLASSFPVWEGEAEAIEPALRVAVSFDTWRTLTGSGLDDADAARLAARMVAGLVPRATSEGGT